MLNNVRSIASCFVALSFVVAACGDGDSDEGGTGGGAGKGGTAGTSGAPGKGGSAGSSAGKGGGGGTAGSTAGSAGSAGSNAGTAGSNAGTSGSAGAAGSGEGGTGGSGEGGNAGASEGGTGNAGTPGGSAGEGGMPTMGGTGGDDGSGGAPEGGMGGEGAGAGGVGNAGEGGVPAVAGAGGEGGAPVVVFDTLDNPSFQDWSATDPVAGWMVVGTPDAAKTSWRAGGARTGSGFLDMWLATAYEVTVSQVVSPIADGSYTLTLYQRGGGPAYIDQYVYVTGYDENEPSAEMTADTIVGNVYTAITIANIPVTSGEIEIGLYSNGPAEAWTNIDDVSLTMNPE